MIHDLKIHSCFFEQRLKKTKTFECRKNDRGYSVGDILNLREYDAENTSYTGRSIRARIKYILSDDFPGIQKTYCILGIKIKKQKSVKMDLDYFKKEIISQRKKEIKQQKNRGCHPPIYVVYSLKPLLVEGHDEGFLYDTNLKREKPEKGYIDRACDGEDVEFKETKTGMKSPLAMTQF